MNENIYICVVYVDVMFCCIRFSYQGMIFPDVEELCGMMGKDDI